MSMKKLLVWVCGNCDWVIHREINNSMSTKTCPECEHQMRSAFQMEPQDLLVEEGQKHDQGNPLDTQVGGSHYKDFPIQPVEFVTKNNLSYLQGAIIKRFVRYNMETGGGLKDLNKAKHEIDLLIHFIMKED